MAEQQEISEAMKELEGAVGDARRHFGDLIKNAQVQLTYAREQQARWKREMKPLEAFKDDVSRPENNTYVSMDLLHQTYVAMQAMLELEIAGYEHNLEVVGPNGSLGHGNLQVPTRTLAYLEQKRRMDLAHARYLVRFNLPGIDAVLRATGLGQCITPASDAQRAERAEVVGKLTSAAEASQGLGRFLERLSADLLAVRQLNKWGMQVFDAWDATGADARKALIEHPDWSRLEGQIPLLQELHERTATYLPLQAVFVPWKREPLPFAAQKHVAAQPAPARKGTDRLDLQSGSTGRQSTIRLQ